MRLWIGSLCEYIVSCYHLNVSLCFSIYIITYIYRSVALTGLKLITICELLKDDFCSNFCFSSHLFPSPSLIFAGGANDNYVRSVRFSREGVVATICDDG